VSAVARSGEKIISQGRLFRGRVDDIVAVEMEMEPKQFGRVTM
jgi:hypothetical protein